MSLVAASQLKVGPALPPGSFIAKEAMHFDKSHHIAQIPLLSSNAIGLSVDALEHDFSRAVVVWAWCEGPKCAHKGVTQNDRRWEFECNACLHICVNTRVAWEEGWWEASESILAV
eukprot:1160720-Pelagomonas_calceolata.AAC.13